VCSSLVSSSERGASYETRLIGGGQEVDGGARPGATPAEAERIKELEREKRELRRANEILKAASAFFARELDPRPRR
jgi:transposase-like protein